MKELLTYVARQLVDLPDQVEVREIEGERSIILELRVAPEDMGKVIGRQGKTAQALRILVKAAGLRDGKRVMVEII
ncbi:MAG: KH domain-containing protein [Candidatus Xenobium sp.]|nr:KH domain-containing protein [Burkholderiales bacterium]